MNCKLRRLVGFLRWLREPVWHYPLTMCPEARFRERIPRWRAALARAGDAMWAPTVTICLVLAIFVWVFVWL